MEYIYFPGGTYGGAEYTIYYKEPFPVPPVPPEPTPIHGASNFRELALIAINVAVVANSQLQELLPFYYPRYFADFIDEEGHSSPHYFPAFYSFIFIKNGIDK